MGLTDSNSKYQDTEQKYKLIRRFTSDNYGDLTVIQNKQTQKLYALKETMTEDQLLLKFVKNRKNMTHRNLVNLEEFWFSGDQSICSTIRKIESVFQYFPTSLYEEMQKRIEMNETFSDFEIVQIFTDTIDCLQYLESMGVLHLIIGMKMLLYDPHTRTLKIIQNQETMMHTQIDKKNQLNIIALINNNTNLPLHPLNQPKDVCDVCLSPEKVAHQNLFVIGLICIGLCWMKQPLELGIFSNGSYNFEKIEKRICQLKNKFPQVYKVLSIYLFQKCPSNQWNYGKILSKLKSERKSFTKQNQKPQKHIDIQPIQKVGQRRSKKLSYLREMRLSNNDIPSQF